MPFTIQRSFADVMAETKLEPRGYQLYIGDKTVKQFAGCHYNWAGELEGAAKSIIIESPTGCLVGSTEIIVNLGGKSIRSTLREAYLHFHGGDHTTQPGECLCGCGQPTKVPTKFKRNRKWPLATQVPGVPIRYIHGHQNRGYRWQNTPMIRSFQGDHGIGLQRAIDFVRSGVKPVYKLVLADGKVLVGTACHQIMTDIGWIALGSLRIGTKIMVDRTQPTASARPAKDKPQDTHVCGMDNHPHSRRVKTDKYAAGFTMRVPKHILTCEAHDNLLTMDDYIWRIRASRLDGLSFIDPAKYVVHHADGNHHNDALGNHELLTRLEHDTLHGTTDFYENFGNAIPDWSEVVSVEPAGEEMTYDVCCEAPHHNFVANGIVVHNSGKTPLALTICRTMQDNIPGLEAVWVSMRRNLLKQASFENAPPSVLSPEGKDIGAKVEFVSMFAREVAPKLYPDNRQGKPLLFIIDECLPYDSLVETEVGRVAIGDVVTKGVATKVLGRDNHGQRVLRPIIQRTLMGRKEILEVRYRTPSGEFILPITEHGRVWTDRGYVRAHTLAIGDTITTLASCWPTYSQEHESTPTVSGGAGIACGECAAMPVWLRPESVVGYLQEAIQDVPLQPPLPASGRHITDGAADSSCARDAAGRRLVAVPTDPQHQNRYRGSSAAHPALHQAATTADRMVERGTIIAVVRTGCYEETFDIAVEAPSWEEANFWADGVLVHNCQHDAAASCLHLHNELRPDYILGLSATPYRTDRVKLTFEKVNKDAGIHTLIQDGYLSEYEHYTIPDWQPDTVADFYLMNPDEWGPSLVFFNTIERCEMFYERMVDAGVSCDMVTGNTDREDQIEKLKNDTYQVLVNCAVLTEGFNFPDLRTVWTRDSGKGPTIQMNGRVFRKSSRYRFKRVVQSKDTRWPMLRTATPYQSLVWRDNGWLTLKTNQNIERVADNTRIALAQLPPMIPRQLLENGRGKGKKRNRF